MTIDILHDTDNLKVCIQLCVCLCKEMDKGVSTRNIVVADVRIDIYNATMQSHLYWEWNRVPII